MASTTRDVTTEQCVHCHRPLVVHAVDPRWHGYCSHCIQLALARRRHPESA